MKYGIKMTPATLADVYALVRDMRPEEVAEVDAAMGLGPLEAVQQSIAVSRDTYACRHEGKLLAIFGVNPTTRLSLHAVPWLLTTVHCPKQPRILLHWSKYVLSSWKTQYSLLFNYVDARYTQSLAWARHVGFEVKDPEPFGHKGLPFRRIEIRKS